MKRYYAVCEWVEPRIHDQFIEGPFTLEELLGYIGRNCVDESVDRNGINTVRVAAIIQAERGDAKDFPDPEDCLNIDKE